MAKGNSDLELLIKMMGQTTNENDNIVLVSIRKANEQVKKLAGSWDELLRGHFTIAADPFQGLSDPLAQAGDDSFRRGVSPVPPAHHTRAPHTPPPPPDPRRPPPPPRTPQPGGFNYVGPQPSAASGTTARINRFKAVCYKCNHYCLPGEGYLDGKNPITGDWKVKCNNSHRCAANQSKGAKAQKSNPARGSIDNIFNMVD